MSSSTLANLGRSGQADMPSRPLYEDETLQEEATNDSAVELHKLRIRDLRKTYGEIVALSDATIDVRSGEFLTLLGPSGSGKSTLLWLVAGLIQPDQGEIWIGSRLATKIPPHSREIGVVFQNYALFPHMTVFENIGFPLRMRRYAEPRVKEEVQKILEIVQLPTVAGRYPSELSGGQQQRIALARCMVYKPSIILMDEPLGALDKHLRHNMQLEIKRLHETLNTTIIYVTHDQEEALTMSDRICLMNNGKIEQIDPPGDLYFNPNSFFAAEFLGDSNFIDGTIQKIDDNRIVLQSRCGVRLSARRSSHSFQLGQPVRLMVRPESIELINSDFDIDNKISASVERVVITGSITKYYVRIGSGDLLVVSRLTRIDQAKILKGEQVYVGWSPYDCIILPGIE